ncbi:hypothetical protein OOK47_09695 [Streptomyces sp. NBC_00268]|nr:hypothetical protein [Streptomyces sp. NBC_00268]
MRRFPTARAWALPGAIEMMHRQATNGRAEMWDRVFPGLIGGDTPVLAAPVPETGLLLEGHELPAVETGHTDTDDSSVLHVPSIGLVVAGDVVYNNVHLYLCEGVLGGFTAWLRALDIVEDLEPDSVVAGHQDRTRPDTPDTIAQTRAYLHDVEDLLTGEPTPHEFFDAMIQRHSGRLNPAPLWYGAPGSARLSRARQRARRSGTRTGVTRRRAAHDRHSPPIPAEGRTTVSERRPGNITTSVDNQPWTHAFATPTPGAFATTLSEDVVPEALGDLLAGAVDRDHFYAPPRA